MRCPVDNETLVMADRGGVEIDYCPKCRGVWLDRGELDKIIDRAAADVAPVVQPQPAAAPRPAAPYPPQQPGYGAQPVYQQPPYGGQRDWDDDDRDGYGRKRKKKGLLGEIFDF